MGILMVVPIAMIVWSLISMVILLGQEYGAEAGLLLLVGLVVSATYLYLLIKNYKK